MRVLTNSSAGSRNIAAMIIVVILSYAGIAWRVSSIVGYDAAVGFLVYRSVESGAPFNHLRTASHSALSSDESEFMATYSPGQYMVPGALTRLGMTLRKAIWLTTLLAIAAGLLGYFFLFVRVFGFSVRISTLSCLFLLLTRPIGTQFFEYLGGTLLEFAGIPYMIIGASYCLKRGVAWRLALPAIFLCGAFLKLSMAVLSLAICVYAAITDLYDRKRSRSDRVGRAIAAIFSFVIFYAIMGAFFTSKGWTAAASHRIGGVILSTILFSVLYSVASLTSGITSLFSILSPLKAPLDPAMLSNSPGAPATLLPLLAVLAIISILLILWVLRKRLERPYSKMLLAVAFTYVAAMSYIYGTAGARLEFRHFWLVGAFLLPGVIEELSGAAGRVRATAVGIGVFVCLFGVASAGAIILRNNNALRVGDFSFDREETPAATLIKAAEASSDHAEVLIFANDPRVALLVRESRLAFQNGDRFYSIPYRGTVNSLMVIVESQVAAGEKAQQIVSMFPDMSNWRTASVGPFTVLVAGPVEPPRAIASILRAL
jgi:hypothetical protein